MSEGAPRHSSGGGTVLRFIAAILGALICFIGAAAEASALGRPHRASTTLLTIVAIAFAVAAIALGRLAIHLEHSMRGPAGAATPAVHPAAMPAQRRPKNGPVTRAILAILVIGYLVFMVFISVQLHAKASRSSFTQHHGISRTGTVEVVHKEHHSSRYSSWNTFNYDVALTTPVDGANRTRAHDPSKDFQAFSAGEPITVLVDTEETGYAELPGQPVQSSTWFVGPLILAVIFVGLFAFIGYEEIKHRRRRAGQASVSTPSPASPST